MASVPIYRLQFNANNPDGEFVAGDIVEIFMETDDTIVPAGFFDVNTQGLYVHKNGVLMSPVSATIPLPSSVNSSLTTFKTYNTTYCVGTSLVWFRNSIDFPYARYSTLEDHNSCSVVPVVCDLTVIGAPEVTPASSSNSADGSIKVNAFSSQPIQYKIGEDFVYNDGTAQTSNEFLALLPGTKRIYLRDANNCSANVIVTVGVDNSYSTRFRLIYDDLKGNSTRIDITRRAYSGPVTEIIADGDPFYVNLRGEGSTDKFEPILAISTDLNLHSVTEKQFLDLYTNDPDLFRIEYYKRIGNVTTPLSLPALSSWQTTSLSSDDVDWTTGATPSVILPGSGALNVKRSELLYADYSFVPGTTYTIEVVFTAVTNSLMQFNPRTAYLRITDSSFTVQASSNITYTDGSNTLSITFTATSECERIALYFSSGSNRTITISSVSGQGNGHQLKLITKVLPQQYIEEYRHTPYRISITGTDGLPELDFFYLVQDDGQKYFGTVSLIKLVAYCLSFLKLNLPIRVACNLYADNMDQDDTDDPFDQAYCDYEAFYLSEEEPTLLYVLRSILEPFGARITQWDGRWNIVRVEEMSGPYDYRDFDANGNYVAHGTYNPVVEIDYPKNNGDVLLVNRDHNLEMRPGYGIIKVLYDLGLKPNILENGDFKLRGAYFQETDSYYYTINKDGWTLVNGGYTLTENHEIINANNVAYVISANADVLINANGGNAYITSGTYHVRMGANNQLGIKVRLKIPMTAVSYGSQVYSVEVPYIKARVRVKYGPLYLQADGTWTTSENILTFYITEFDKYTDFEVIAVQPIAPAWNNSIYYFVGAFVAYNGKTWKSIVDSNIGNTPSEGAYWSEITVNPLAGMDLEVRVYHAYPYHADHASLTSLKAVKTYANNLELRPTGYKTELRDTFTVSSWLWYYELKETTDAENGYVIVRPNDYNAINNPRQWVLNTRRLIFGVQGNTYPMHIDSVVIKFLTDREDPIDAISRMTKGEANNKDLFEKKLILGSYSTLIVTDIRFGIAVGLFNPTQTGLTSITKQVLVADLIYTGYLRSESGEGYEWWKRDAVAEKDKLHGIWLKMYARQYIRSWQLFRGSFYANTYFSPIDSLTNVNDSNRFYIPMGLSLNDKQCIYSGELLELNTDSGGSDGSGSSPFSSAFSTGFGASGFN
jgi:hypothetical protein